MYKIYNFYLKYQLTLFFQCNLTIPYSCTCIDVIYINFPFLVEMHFSFQACKFNDMLHFFRGMGYNYRNKALTFQVHLSKLFTRNMKLFNSIYIFKKLIENMYWKGRSLELQTKWFVQWKRFGFHKILTQMFQIVFTNHMVFLNYWPS
jgi:hypothetical protein